MRQSFEYRIRFLERHGVPIEERLVEVESAAAAVKLAAEIATELEAVDFRITLLPPVVCATQRSGIV